MKLVGLTGGIATGKSTASSHLRTSHHLPIVDADLVARQVVEPDQPAFYSLVATFGTDIVNPETHALDRAKLGAIVFNDPAARNRLNGITHPVIRVEMLRQVLWAFLRGNRVCILDTPLLFEAGLYKFVSVVIVIAVPVETQKMRLRARDKCTPADAQSRIDSQMPIAEKCKRADIVIDNSGEAVQTYSQLDRAVADITPNKLINALWWVALAGPALGLYGALGAYLRVKQWCGQLVRAASKKRT
ncbi:dephospho-CoA kinase-domain-containing protein [Powellomyces hirtus]|nr:dephospho-CoA kinase-domain-containing protein [Powellomyces hirtus]